MLSVHKRWQKTFICSAIKQKWYESGGLDTGGSEGREYECWLWIPGGEHIWVWLERSGEEKFNQSKNTTLKSKQISQQSAWSWEYTRSMRSSLPITADTALQLGNLHMEKFIGNEHSGSTGWIWPDAAEPNVWGWTSLPRGGRGRCNAAFPSVPILRADTLLYELLRSP